MRRIRARIIRAALGICLICLIFAGGRFFLHLFSAEEGIESVFFRETFAEDEPCIVLDAGHGGNDQGTSAGKVLEKDINLEVVKLLEKELKKKDIPVRLTRESDRRVELSERAEFANEHSAVLFVSVHCNYCEDSSKVSGAEIYYREGSDGGKLFAEAVSARFDEETEIKNRGTRTDDFKVLRETKMPAVLVELGFLSNASERGKLQEKDYQKLLAECIAETIEASDLGL